MAMARSGNQLEHFVENKLFLRLELGGTCNRVKSLMRRGQRPSLPHLLMQRRKG